MGLGTVTGCHHFLHSSESLSNDVYREPRKIRRLKHYARVILLWHLGSYPVAMVIFLASIFIPMAKMFALGWLYWQAGKLNVFPEQQNLKRLKVYRVTEFIGRWSMIDIFVVAILVSLVQLHNLMAIYPGPAALSFAAVVLLTMLSAMVFDSRILWHEPPESPPTKIK